MSNFHLPDECWESIFKFLNKPHHLDTLSLVSNQFFNITNNLFSSLTISYNPLSLPYLPRLLTRFPNIRSLDLRYFQGDLHALLLQLSQSPSLPALDSLKIRIYNSFPAGFRALAQKIPSLKSLTLTLSSDGTSPLTLADILLLLQCFPSLEELDLSCYDDVCGSDNSLFAGAPVSDTDIEALSLALPKLRKVMLCGDYYFIKDSLLFHLCKNCHFLEQVKLIDCRMVSQDGIARAFKVRPNLTSFMYRYSNRPGFVFVASLVCLKQLTCLSLGTRISDELLFSVARAGLPLRKLCLLNGKGYSYDGISFLLSKCRLIQHLNLFNSAEFLEYKHIKELSKFLGNLMSIDLSGCYQLGYLSFILLTRNCPLLNEIEMLGTSFGAIADYEVLDSTMNSLADSNNIANFQVKSLRLSNGKGLMDVNVEIFALLCPNLEVLSLDGCKCLSAIEVLKKCPKIKYLSLFSHTEVDLSWMKSFQFPNLEVLRLSSSEIDDKALFILSKSCPSLLELDMTHCSKITAKGVKHVVKRCKQLREIDLTLCQGVAPSVVAWMVSSRQSLRKIYAPPQFRISESLKELFLHRGCLVTGYHL